MSYFIEHKLRFILEHPCYIIFDNPFENRLCKILYLKTYVISIHYRSLDKLFSPLCNLLVLGVISKNLSTHIVIRRAFE